MASLTETAIAMRASIKILILLIVVGLIGFYGYKYVKTTFIDKVEPIAPTMLYQTLDDKTFVPPRFPNSEYEYPKSFSIDTTNGEISNDILYYWDLDEPPTIDHIATVPALAKPKVSFNSKDQIIEKAKRLQFSDNPVIRGQTATFTDTQYEFRKLVVDMATQHFHLTYDYLQDPTIFNSTHDFDFANIVSEARAYLDKWKEFPDTLEKGETTVQYYIFNQSQLIETEKENEAEAVRVNFFPETMYGMKPVYDKPRQSSTYVIFSEVTEFKRHVIEAGYNYYEIEEMSQPNPNADGTIPETDPNATYLVITAREAFDQLQNNQGYIAEYDGSEEISITEEYPGYYVDEVNLFMYPVYVFTGNGFTAYVSAVREEQFEVSDTRSKTRSPAESEESVQGISTKRSVSPIVITPKPLGSGLRSPTQPKKFGDLLRQP